MQNSKLVRTFEVLTPEEVKQLHAFLQSPFYNTNASIVKMYKLLSRQYPDFNSPKITKEAVWEKLFPGRPFARQQMLNLMSEFCRLLEKYLIQIQLNKKEMWQDELLLEAYEERPNCFAVFEKKISALDKKLDELPFRDEIYFNKKKELNLKYYSHPDTNIQIDDRGTLQKAIGYFDGEKKLGEIKLKCAANARANTINNKREVTLNFENPLLDLYGKLERFQRSGSAEEHSELIKLFMANIHLARIEDQRNILKILLNYSIRQTNLGHSEFAQKSWKLYKLGLEQDCLLVHGKISKNVFQNISSFASLCGEFAWAKSFMDDFQGRLDDEQKADAVAMSMGLWHFEKKEYVAAIDCMQHVFQEPLDVFKSKALLVRSWFELWLRDESYFEFLSVQLESFEKFTRRNKSLTPNLKKAFLKFILLTKKIIYLNRNERAIKKIETEIMNEPELVLKKWLIEKVYDLK